MPTYRTDQTYETNYSAGPDFAGPLPMVPTTPTKQLFGRDVRSRVGIAAGLLLNSKWIELYAKLGYDLLTYKTVRSKQRACYPPPNWVRIAVDRELPADPEVPLTTIEPVATEDVDATWAVCFGIPSMAPDVWRADVERAKRCLVEGQLLNVSVVGTPEPDWDLDALADDFARCAAWAAESGADLIEANFSCPNVCTAEGQIYHDPASSKIVAQRIRQAIGDRPLLIKAGHFTHPDRLAEFVRSLNGIAQAIVLVNAIQRRVHRPDGQWAFAGHERVGIVGRATHSSSVANCAQAARVVRELGGSLAIFGVGGVATPQDCADYFAAGAQAVFLGSAPMVNPTLGVQIKHAHPAF